MPPKTYRPPDLLSAQFIITIQRAKHLWAKRCKEHYQKHGDTGTCVLGASIDCYIIPYKCRKYKPYCLISAHDVACSQGASNWENSVKEVIDYLKENGIEAHYNCGHMD